MRVIVLMGSVPRKCLIFFFLMIRRPPRSTLDRSSAASDVYKRQDLEEENLNKILYFDQMKNYDNYFPQYNIDNVLKLSLIHISEPTRPY